MQTRPQCTGDRQVDPFKRPESALRQPAPPPEQMKYLRDESRRKFQKDVSNDFQRDCQVLA